MSPIPLDTHSNPEAKKLYSQRAIGIATYLGGPVAAGILVRQNYINLGKEEYGLRTLFISVISTFLLFVGIFSIPDEIIDKIPNAVIPAIYTVIIYFIVEALQGRALKAHKESKGEFYSAWKAAGVGAICMVFLIAGVLAYDMFIPADFDAAKYDKGLAEFQENEDKALVLFTLVDEADQSDKAVEFIQRTGLPHWRKNIEVLNDMDSIEGLPQEFKTQNALLREYCELRIKSYELIRKGLDEGTDEDLQQIENINKRIDEIMGQL